MKTLALSMIALLFPFVLTAQDTYSLDEEYDMNLSGTISLNTDDAKVTIKGTNRSNVSLKVYRKITTKGFSWGDTEFEIEVDQRNGDLKISERSSGSHVSVVGYMHEEYTIDIEVPLGVSLDIKGDDDDYQISDIRGSIALDMDDGDATLKNCTGNDFRFNLDDGDINMTGGTGSLYVKADDGDVEIANATFTNVNASVDDGDLVIDTSLADDGNYSFRADDSDLVLNITGGGGDIDISHDDSRLYTSGDFKMLRDTENKTQLKLGDGTAIVKIRVDDASISLNNN